MASRVAQPNKVVASVPMVILVDMPTAHATWVPEPSPGQWKMEVTFFCQRACGGECKKDGQGSIGELDMICPSCFINILFCVRTLAVLTLGLGSTCVLFPATWSCTSEEPKTSQNLFPLRPHKMVPTNMRPVQPGASSFIWNVAGWEKATSNDLVLIKNTAQLLAACLMAPLVGV